MKRTAIILLLMSYCGFLFSQILVFSERFETTKKNSAIELLNTNPHYFYLLRYNKEAHDFTIERRSKPTAKVLTFTRLKLDSVNANWFDYSKLDYILFEHEQKLYFIFERELNSKKEIYLKIIDTTGRSSGFIPVASLEKSASSDNIRFVFQLVNKTKLLIISEEHSFNFVIRKTALLYDPIKRSMRWSKRLPPESELTGYSTAFECNADGDLFYVQIRSRVISHRRKFVSHLQILEPVFFYDFILLHHIANDSIKGSKIKLPVENISSLYSISLHADKTSVTSTLHFALQDSVENENVFFLNHKLSKNLDASIYTALTPLDQRLTKQLTFYDGTDYKDPSDKEYRLRTRINNEQRSFITGERVYGDYYKEMLLWKTDLTTGKILNQEIIPRRGMFYDDLGRKHNTTQLVFQNTLYSFLLEDTDNFNRDPRAFSYHDFYEQSFHDDCYLVAYVLHPGGHFEKRLVYDNIEYMFQPIKYQSDQSDFMFCVKRGRSEKFVILKLNPSL
jgi:hypothetical protein